MSLDGEIKTSPDAPQTVPPAQALMLKWGRIYQTWLDKTVVWPQSRWGFFGFALVAYCLRVHLIQGFYIVTYALGIYLLNLVIGFLSPAQDPEEMEDGGPMLPTFGEAEEYRPFSRKVPEFKFWVAGTKSVLFSLVATFFPCFDLPVFWPILLAYFILLVFITMKERIKHMIKFKYVPFSVGKQSYRDLTKTKAPGSAGKKDAK